MQCKRSMINRNQSWKQKIVKQEGRRVQTDHHPRPSPSFFGTSRSLNVFLQCGKEKGSATRLTGGFVNQRGACQLGARLKGGGERVLALPTGKSRDCGVTAGNKVDSTKRSPRRSRFPLSEIDRPALVRGHTTKAIRALSNLSVLPSPLVSWILKRNHVHPLRNASQTGWIVFDVCLKAGLVGSRVEYRKRPTPPPPLHFERGPGDV